MMSPLHVLRIYLLLIFGLPFSLTAQSSDSLRMCSPVSSSSATSGVVYDPGGPYGSYFNNNNCYLSIAPGCADELTLHLTSFASEAAYDYLYIYDGTDASAPLLGIWTGLAAPATVTALSGKAFLRWYTDGSQVADGFQLEWTSTLLPPVAPAAGFWASDTLPAFSEYVTFTDTTNNFPIAWEWDFGDSTVSNEATPVHQFPGTGSYTVQLIVTNCYGLTDTISQVITVQAPPSVAVSPAAVSISGPCDGTPVATFDLANTGMGDLIYSVSYSGPFPGNFVAETGIVNPDSSTAVSFHFNAFGYLAGTYTGSFYINSNDTANSTIEVPWTLEVTGQPLLTVLPQTVDFGYVNQFKTVAQDLLIQNDGCSPLVITGVTSGNPVFELVNMIYPFELPPFSNTFIQVSCTPQDTGWVTGNFSFTSNAGTQGFTTQVFGVGVPVVSVAPLAVSATLSCDDSTAVTVQIINSGLADLYIQPEPTVQPANVLLLDALSYNYYPSNNVYYWISVLNPNIQFYSLQNDQTPGYLDSYFSQADIAVLPAFGGYGWYTPEQITTALHKFVQRGGTLLITGTQSPYLLREAGLWDASDNYYNFSGNYLTPVDPAHPFVQNIDFQNNVSYNNILGVQVFNTSFEPVIENSGYQILATRNEGAGQIIYMGYECGYAEYHNSSIVQNIYKSAANPSWLNYTLPTIVPAGDTADVVLQLQSTGLVSGQYSYQINMSTNDPAQSYISVPVTLTVDGEPEISVSNTPVQFGILQQFTTTTQDVPVTNTGCDTLFLTAITLSNPDFEVVDAPDFILPGEQQNLHVIFHPQSAGMYQETLTIGSNSSTAVVNVSALVFGAPVVSADAAATVWDVNCADTRLEQIALVNTGTGNYSYSTDYTGNTRVALFQYGTNYLSTVNIESELYQTIPNLVFAQIDNPDPAAVAAVLENVDILVIPAIGIEDPLTFSNLKIPVQDFIHRGGLVLMAGLYFPAPLLQMGLVDNGATFGLYYDNVLKNDFPDYTLTANLTGGMAENGAHFVAQFPVGSDFQSILGLQSGGTDIPGAYLSVKNEGNGFVVWFGHNFEDGSQVIRDRVLANVAQWAYQPIAPGITLVSGTSGVVLANASTNLELEVTGNNLPGGLYPGQIRLYGNDPQHNPIYIPASVNAGFQPCAAFDIIKDECSGLITLTDQTLNGLTSWYWTFGDGTEATVTNPAHTYAQSGDYLVTLVGCNSTGCDTASQMISLTISTGPVAACPSPSLSVCCESGVQQVVLGDIDHTSGNALTEGYQDFSCLYGTELDVDVQHLLTVTTGVYYSEYVTVWLDFNNNGSFEANEKVMNDYGYINHSGYITIPANAVKDVRLRLRVVAGIDNYPSACGGVSNGQTEDYYVVLKKTVGTVALASTLQAAIFPNPAAGPSQLVFHSETAQSAVLTITNALGQTVLVKHIGLVAGEQKTELPQQAAGAYMVRLQAGHAVFTGTCVWAGQEP